MIIVGTVIRTGSRIGRCTFSTNVSGACGSAFKTSLANLSNNVRFNLRMSRQVSSYKVAADGLLGYVAKLGKTLSAVFIRFLRNSFPPRGVNDQLRGLTLLRPLNRAMESG